MQFNIKQISTRSNKQRVMPATIYKATKDKIQEVEIEQSKVRSKRFDFKLQTNGKESNIFNNNLIVEYDGTRVELNKYMGQLELVFGVDYMILQNNQIRLGKRAIKRVLG